MRLLLVLSALFTISAQADTGRVLVSCDPFPFTDVVKVELVETDLTGQVYVRETDSRGEKNDIRVYYNISDIYAGGEFSASDWHGYTRKLTRVSPGQYLLTTQDECTSSHHFLTCSEY